MPRGRSRSARAGELPTASWRPRPAWRTERSSHYAGMYRASVRTVRSGNRRVGPLAIQACRAEPSPVTVSAPPNVLDPFLYSADPAPAYKWLRDEAPVHWDSVNAIWVISRHRDVMLVERDTIRYSSARGSRP